MIYISLEQEKTRELPFYLAMEEFVAMTLDIKEAFFMWQVEPSVIFGRNQLIEKEVNLPYCKEHKISTFRRKSGGGCVYADKGNIMFSYITDNYNVKNAYNNYLNRVVTALNKLGVKAESTGRNDIVVDNRKISGSAFYHVNGKSIVHGTMLFDTNMSNMINAITPATIKLQSKGVESVRSRITLLKEYLNVNITEFKESIKSLLCKETITLDETSVDEIEKIEQLYLSDNFIYGKNPRFNIENNIRIEGVGDFKALIEVDKSIIKNINIMGDYFLNEEIDVSLLERLKGVAYNVESIRKVVDEVNICDIILNMDNEQFIKLIIN